MFFFANLNCLQGGVNNLITYTNINCFDLPPQKKTTTWKIMGQNPTYWSAYLLQCCWFCWYFRLLNLRSSHPAAINHLQKLLCWPPGDLADWGLDQVRGPNRGVSNYNRDLCFYLQTLWQDAADIKFTTVFYIHVNMYDIYIYTYHLLLSIIFYCLPGAKEGSIKSN